MQWLLSHRPRSRKEVVAAAERFSLHPGIVVGALQHHRVVPYKHLNDLKARFVWADEVAVAPERSDKKATRE